MAFGSRRNQQYQLDDLNLALDQIHDNYYDHSSFSPGKSIQSPPQRKQRGKPPPTGINVETLKQTPGTRRRNLSSPPAMSPSARHHKSINERNKNINEKKNETRSILKTSHRRHTHQTTPHTIQFAPRSQMVSNDGGGKSQNIKDGRVIGGGFQLSSPSHTIILVCPTGLIEVPSHSPLVALLPIHSKRDISSEEDRKNKLEELRPKELARFHSRSSSLKPRSSKADATSKSSCDDTRKTDELEHPSPSRIQSFSKLTARPSLQTVSLTPRTSKLRKKKAPPPPPCESPPLEEVPKNSNATSLVPQPVLLLARLAGWDVNDSEGKQITWGDLVPPSNEDAQEKVKQKLEQLVRMDSSDALHGEARNGDEKKDAVNDPSEEPCVQNDCSLAPNDDSRLVMELRDELSKATLQIETLEKAKAEQAITLTAKVQALELSQTVEGADALVQKVAMLNQQLTSHGIEPISEVVDLDEAKRRLRQALQSMMDGDYSAGAELDKWDNYIKCHPDHIKEVEEQKLKWMTINHEKNVAALRETRRFIPPDIFSTNFDELLRQGLPLRLAKRIWDMKILWLCRCEPSFAANIHPADLKSKYVFHLLDIVELRSVWNCLPEEFDNDPTGEKAEWKANLLQKLQELVSREEKNALTKNQKRHSSYSDLAGFYDPDAMLVKIRPRKSTAFDKNELPG